MERDGRPAMDSETPPAAPRLRVRGDVFDLSDARYTRDEHKIPTYLFDDSIKVAFDLPSIETRVHYTLDGTEPTQHSSVYLAPFQVNQSCTLKARTIDSSWTCGPTQSQVLTANFERRVPQAALESGGKQPGLLTQVFELKTVIYDDRGFWRANRVMMPDLRDAVPLLSRVASTFDLPSAAPVAPFVEQRKGFYRFKGFFLAPETGIYQFSVDSCGPITLDFGSQTAIEHTGQFHQQQAVRSGDVALQRGWHPIELVVTDPLFWKLNTDDLMPFEVTFRVNGGGSQKVRPDQLSCTVPAGIALSAEPVPPTVRPATGLPELEAGVERREYDRSSTYQPFVPPDPGWLDIESLASIETRLSDFISPNTGDAVVVEYSGYFFAPEPGLYRFDLPSRADEHTTGDQVRTGDAADRNQLRLGGTVIVQRGVPGRTPLRAAYLPEVGYYPISIRLGKSRAGGSVTYPSGQTLPLTASGLFRIMRPRIAPDGQSNQASSYEIYRATDFHVTLPVNSAAKEIRYTLDGTEPHAESSALTGNLRIDRDAVITAAGFKDNQPATASAQTHVRLVERPVDGLVHFVDGSELSASKDSVRGIWLDQSSKVVSADGRTFIQLHGGSAGKAMPSATSRPVDANLDKGTSGAGLRLVDLKLPRNAITVAMRVRVADVSQARLFGKWGYNSIGKRWRSIACELRDGQLVAEPGGTRWGQIQPNVWNHIALVADSEQIKLYVNGKAVAQGDGTDQVAAGSLDFGVNSQIDVSDVRVYGRALGPDDIQALAQ